MTGLVWFNPSSLRVQSHPAVLTADRQHVQVEAIFFITIAQWQAHGLGATPIAWLLGQVNALGEALALQGIPLHLYTVKNFKAIPAALAAHCHQTNVTTVYTLEEPGDNEQRLVSACQQTLQEAAIDLHSCGYVSALPPRIKTKRNAPFAVFTPFKREWLQHWQAATPLSTSPALRCRPPIRFIWPAAAPALPETGAQHGWLWGEAAAHQQLNQFITHKLADYATLRDYPSLNHTSGLSVYLNYGVLSTPQCLQAVAQHYPLEDCYQPTHPAFAWINELIWRDFYLHLLWHEPRLSRYEPFQRQYQQRSWPGADAHFTAWCTGQTGFPLIDAAMRCLVQTGRMHNRLRMIVASFLVKDLLVDWRRGEAFFMTHLLDANWAANNGGWQWCASTGADAVPYFRIFNPLTQSQRFDPQGDFIRRYVPELAGLNNQDIHAPPQRDGLNYPAPIVNHAAARLRALAWFGAIKSIT